MIALALAVVLTAADEAPGPAFENDLSGFDFPVSKGGTHLIGIGGVIGTGATIAAIVVGLSRTPQGDASVDGAIGAGLFALFLGGGLTGARLLQPTPPAAWGSFWAGTAGAAVGFVVALNTRSANGLVSPELMLAGSAAGYLAASVVYLVLPDASTLSWKEFWATVGSGVLVGGALFAISATDGFRNQVLTTLALISPVTFILAARLVFAFWQPFDPWVDDLKPPFRAEPIIALTPTGASVGLAGSW